MYLNARSIVGKIDDLTLTVGEISPDIIFITETWLSSDVSDAHLSLEDFVVYRRDRNNGADPHGGVLIAVKSHLNPVCVNIVTDFEVCFIDIFVNNEKIRIGVTYRPPSYNVQKSADFIQFIRSILENDTKFCLFGDFNFPNIDWDTYSAATAHENYLIACVHELNMVQKVSEPTRENSILDLILCSQAELVTNVTVHETFSTSDHSYITCSLSVPNMNSIEDKICFDFKNADWDLIRATLSITDWTYVFSECNDNCNLMWTNFTVVVNNIINAHIPTFVVSKGRNAPWMNSYLKRIIRVKKRKWLVYRNNRSVRNLSEYRNHCKFVKKKVLEARKRYELLKFENKNNKAKEFFKYIDNKTKLKCNIPVIKENNIDLTSNIDKASALSRQYQSVFTHDDGNVPPFNQLMPENSFTDIEITDRDILSAVHSMNGNGAPGDDNIHPKFVKNVYHYLIKPLKVIFRCSLSSGVLPEGWKRGIIVPVYKNNGKPSSSASYRPICLTSVICKLFESVLRRHLTDYFQINNLISDKQHGFLKKRSTATNLLGCLNDWTKFVDGKSCLDVVYIDLEKAFDTVSHTKLLLKLGKLGIGGNVYKWLSDFLCDRQQCVRVCSDVSPSAHVVSGIPQGTILGPLLFVLYINDLPNHTSNCSLELYADDSKLYNKINTVDDCLDLADDLLNIQHWFDLWQLRINVNKCELLHIGRNNINFPYRVQQYLIPEKLFCKDLGIYVTDDLSVRKHCSVVARNAFFRLRQFSMAFVCNDRMFKVFLYSTYVRPLLESNTSLWSPHYVCDIDLIESVQRRFTKKLTGLTDVSYMDRLNALGLETLEVRRIISDLILVYKIVHHLIDLEFTDFFVLNTNVTRGHRFKLRVQFSRINCRRHFFNNRIVHVWNDLASSVVESANLGLFRKALDPSNLSHYCKGRAYTA